MSMLARNDEQTTRYGQKTQMACKELGRDYNSTAERQGLRPVAV